MVRMTKRKQWYAYQSALIAYESATGFAKGVIYEMIIMVLLGPHLAMIVSNGCPEQPTLMEVTTPTDQP